MFLVRDHTDAILFPETALGLAEARLFIYERAKLYRRQQLRQYLQYLKIERIDLSTAIEVESYHDLCEFCPTTSEQVISCKYCKKYYCPDCGGNTCQECVLVPMPQF